MESAKKGRALLRDLLQKRGEFFKITRLNLHQKIFWELPRYLQSQHYAPRLRSLSVWYEPASQNYFDSIMSSLARTSHPINSVSFSGDIHNVDAVAELLENNTTVTSLSISTRNHGSLDLDGLSPGSSFIRKLDVMCGEALSAEEFRGFLKVLPRFSCLNELVLIHSNVTRSRMAGLLYVISTSSLAVKKLHLGANDMQQDEDVYLGISCPSLKELDLGENDFSDGVAIGQILGANPQLEILDVGITWLNDDSVYQFSHDLKTCTGLRKLQLYGNDRLGDDGAIELAKHLPCSLAKMDFSSTSINYDGVSALLYAAIPLPFLKTLNLSASSKPIDIDSDADLQLLCLAITSLLEKDTLTALEFDFDDEYVTFPPSNTKITAYKRFSPVFDAPPDTKNCNVFVMRNHYQSEYLDGKHNWQNPNWEEERHYEILATITALDPLCLPIFLVVDIIDWSFALVLKDIELKYCGGKNYFGDEVYFERAQRRKKQKTDFRMVQRVREFSVAKRRAELFSDY